MNIGYLPPPGAGLRSLCQEGQESRLLQWYFPRYLEHFQRVAYFSYLRESLDSYLRDDWLRERVTLHPNRWGTATRLYTFTLPLRCREPLRRCGVLRVSQATGAVPAFLTRRLYGIPFVVTYGYHYHEFARLAGAPPWKVSAYWLISHLALKTADAVIVTTPMLRDYVAGIIPARRVWYVPNSVDTAAFAPRAGRGRRPGHPLTVVFVGRLEHQKNLPCLLEAVAMLGGRGVPSRVRLAGDGRQRRELARLASRLGVAVEFLGILPHPQLPALLNGADAFVMPSFSEGHPKALIEAMSCGLPCVASDCAGNRSLITHEVNGLLFDPRRPADLADQLGRIFRDRELVKCLGHNARRSVAEQLAVDRVLRDETARLFALARSA
jgi:glycosyltransferase involved in cell wall biosynthesis